MWLPKLYKQSPEINNSDQEVTNFYYSEKHRLLHKTLKKLQLEKPLRKYQIAIFFIYTRFVTSSFLFLIYKLLRCNQRHRFIDNPVFSTLISKNQTDIKKAKGEGQTISTQLSTAVFDIKVESSFDWLIDHPITAFRPTYLVRWHDQSEGFGDRCVCFDPIFFPFHIIIGGLLCHDNAFNSAVGVLLLLNTCLMCHTKNI